MNQTRDTSERMWQGTLAVLLLVLVMFSNAIVGDEPDRSVVDAGSECDSCVAAVAAARAP
jgi:hypothetical protein